MALGGLQISHDLGAWKKKDWEKDSFEISTE